MSKFYVGLWRDVFGSSPKQFAFASYSDPTTWTTVSLPQELSHDYVDISNPTFFKGKYYFATEGYGSSETDWGVIYTTDFSTFHTVGVGPDDNMFRVAVKTRKARDMIFYEHSSGLRYSYDGDNWHLVGDVNGEVDIDIYDNSTQSYIGSERKRPVAPGVYFNGNYVAVEPTFFQTSPDGTHTFTQYNTGLNSDIYDVFVYDGKLYWITEEGQVFYTPNFTHIYSPKAAMPSVPGPKGFAAVDGKIARARLDTDTFTSYADISLDGGATWQDMSPPPGFFIVKALALYDEFLIVGQDTGSGQLGYRTTSDGQTWSSFFAPLPGSGQLEFILQTIDYAPEDGPGTEFVLHPGNPTIQETPGFSQGTELTESFFEIEDQSFAFTPAPQIAPVSFNLSSEQTLQATHFLETTSSAFYTPWKTFPVNSSWILFLDFGDGDGFQPYYSAINQLVVKEALHENFKPSQTEVSVTLKKDLVYLTKLLQTTHRVEAELWKSNTLFFKGVINPDARGTITYDVENSGFEIVDYSALLENKVEVEETLRGYALCSAVSPETSIVHTILEKAGLNNSYISSSVLEIPKTVQLCTIKEKKKFADILADVLYEYGYIYSFDNFGKLKIINLAPETVAIEHEFSNAGPAPTNILYTLEYEKENKDETTTHVVWSQTKAREDTLLYRGIPDPEKPEVIPYSLYWPPGGNNEKVEQRYKPVIPDREDDIKTLTTYAHYLDTVFETDDIEVYSAEFGEKSASVVFKNTSNTENVELQWFDIRGTLVYEEAEKTTKVASHSSDTFFDELRTNYIFNSADAKVLANILQDRHDYATFSYSWRSFDNVELGSVVKLIDVKSGINTTVVVSKKEFNTVDYIYTYSARALTPFAETAITEISRTPSKSVLQERTQSIRILSKKEKEVSTERATSIDFLNDTDIIYINWDRGQTVWRKAYNALHNGVLLIDTQVASVSAFSNQTILYTDLTGDSIYVYDTASDTSSVLSPPEVSAFAPARLSDSEIAYINYSDFNTLYIAEVFSGGSWSWAAGGGQKVIDKTVSDFTVIDSDRIIYISPENGSVAFLYTISTGIEMPITTSAALTGSMRGEVYYYVDNEYKLRATNITDALDGGVEISGVFDFDISELGDIIYSASNTNLGTVRFVSNQYKLPTLRIPLERIEEKFTADITAGSNRIENVPEEIIFGANLGDTIVGYAIPENTTIISIGADTLDLSNNAELTLFGTELFLNGEAHLVGQSGLAPYAVGTVQIEELAITETKVSDEAISTPKLQANAITANKIAAGAVEAEKIAANAITADAIDTNAIFTLNIQSNNYVAGSTGFDIGVDGTAEFQDIFARGRIEATEGVFQGELQGATGEFSGNLAAATGTFVGQFETAAIKTEQGDENQYTDSFGPSSDQARDIWQGLNTYGLAGYQQSGGLVPVESGTYNGHTVSYIRATYKEFWCQKSSDFFDGTTRPYYRILLYNSGGGLIEPHTFNLNTGCFSSGSANITQTIGYYRGSRRAQHSATLSFTINTGGDKLFFLNTPLSESGLEVGRIYIDNGTVKIKQ